MISATVLSTSVFILPYPPNWAAGGVPGTFEKRTFRDAGMSNREEREELGAKTVASIRYRTLLSATEAAALRTAQLTWDNRPILCPFWPAETKLSDVANASVQGALRIWYEPGFTSWDIGTGGSPTGFTPTAACLTAPVLWGQFVEFPDPKIRSGNDSEECEFSLIETGEAAYALTAKAVTLTNGTSINSQTIPLLTVLAHWGDNSQTIDVRIKRDKVGFGRQTADSYYPQAPRAVHKLAFQAMDDADVAYMLRLFTDRAGSVKPFWAIASHSTTTRVFGRFFGDRLTILWAKPSRGGEVASCQIEFLSLPPEQFLPSGETYGTTMGPKTARWFGYSVTDGTTTWRFTSNEDDVAGPGGTYSHKQISHGRIICEINLEINDCPLEVHQWSGGPFERLVREPLAAPLTVTIYEGPLSAPMSATAIYTGMAVAPKTVGRRMRMRLRGPAAVLSVKGPRMILSKDCAATLGDSRCKKDLPSLRVTTSLLSLTGEVGEFNVSGSGYVASYFQDGYAERTISGVTSRFHIADSYTLGSGKLGLVLVGNFSPAFSSTESGWVLTPGCPGTKDACINRFNNLVNMRAFTEMPDVNPAFRLQPPKAPSGGKK